MREIKFRAWDKDEKKMLRPAVEFQQLLRQVSNRNDNSIGGDAIRRHDLEWMQFTGVTDENGTEIYEGDIVEMLHWEPSRWLVDYSNETGAFFFRHKIEQPYDICHPMRYLERASVIGNIYENPELLDTNAATTLSERKDESQSE